MIKTLACAVALLSAAAATAAAAHTAWLERDARAGAWLLRFGGHEGRLEPVVAAKLKQVTAFDAQGRSLRVQRAVGADGVRLVIPGEPALIALHYDNGVHSRKVFGPSVPKPMNEVPGARSATNAQKHHKTIVRWAPLVTRPLGQPFEVTPLTAAQPAAGETMRVRVAMNGRPAAGVRVGYGEDDAKAVTGADGVAAYTVRPGANQLWAGRRYPVSGNPAYTELSHEYRLGFEAR